MPPYEVVGCPQEEALGGSGLTLLVRRSWDSLAIEAPLLVPLHSPGTHVLMQS